MPEKEDKILNIIQKSGHTFHLKIANKLEELGWIVTNSPYYNDPDSDKAREIDIIAQKEYPVNDIYRSENPEKIIIKLFIECKYINSSTVFWLKKRNLKKAKELATDNPILDDKPDNYLNEMNKHHYVNNNEVSCQWDCESKDVFAEAQHQVLKAMIFFKEYQDSEYYEIDFPIIVINSFEQLAKKEEAQEDYSSITDNFQLEINYSFKDKAKENITKYFLVDIVSLSLLDDFIKQLELKDVALLKGNLEFDLRMQRQRERDSENEQEENPDPYY